MQKRLRLVTLAAVLLFCFAAFATDHFPVGYAYYYYSGPNPETDELIGYYIRDCDRSVVSAGTTSIYRVYEEWPCPHQ